MPDPETPAAFTEKPRRSLTFPIVWFGQLISTLGTGMTGFALVVWTFLGTRSATQVALIAFSVALPGILISPIAGALVDRMDRRLVMLLSDLGSGVMTLLLALLLIQNQLAVWQVYVCSAAISAFSAFQWPAYSASITLLVPPAQLGRANGMVQMSQGLAQLFAPLLAGLLVASVGIQAVLLFDFATFVVAAATLLVVRFPRPAISVVGAAIKKSIWREAGFGLAYLSTRPQLVSLLVVIALANFLQGFILVLAGPYVLTVSTPAALGIASSVAGSGMLAGAILMGVWGGPKRRMDGILAFLLLAGASIALVGAFGSATVFAIGGFGFLFAMPIVIACNQSIWQTKVEPDVQGRVFAVRSMIATAATPLAYLAAGPLADRVFEPLMATGGMLATSAGRLLGVGPGRGIGLLFVVLGSLNILVAAYGYLSRRVRLLEDDLPDRLIESLPAAAQGVA